MRRWSLIALVLAALIAAGPSVRAQEGAAASAADEGPSSYYRVWRIAFRDGAEERGRDIVESRFVPAMEAIGRTAVVHDAEEPWDLELSEGPFATAEAAEPQYEAAFEEALVDQIGDPRVVAAFRQELAALTAAEERVVVERSGAAASP